MKRKSRTCAQHRADLLENLLSVESPLKLSFKQRAHRLIDELPENAGWRELILHAAVRQDIEAGLRDSEAVRIKSVAEVLIEFGLADKLD